jgi:hypothetical protein
MSLTYGTPHDNEDASGDSPAQRLGARLLGEFSELEKARRPVEDRWLKNLRQYKAQYDPEVLERIPKDKKGNFLRSTVFIAHTAAKLDTLKARLVELLFPASGDRNWAISPSPEPEVDPNVLGQYLRHLEEEGLPAPVGKRELVSGCATFCAEKMGALIDDQLSEYGQHVPYSVVCDRVIKSGLMYGTGILKGPLVERRIKQAYRVGPDGRWALVNVSANPDGDLHPFFEHVPPWSIYVDQGVVDPRQLRCVWQDHVFNRRELYSLGSSPGFRMDVIRKHILENKDGDATVREFERSLRSLSDTDRSQKSDKYEGCYRILERWGYLNGEDLIASGVSEEDISSTYPGGLDEAATYESCIWMTEDGKVIKSVLSPLEGVAIPYCFFQPYKDEAGFWSEGLCDRLRPTQEAVNSTTRMTLDHAAITTGPQIAVNMQALSPGEDPTRMHPFKVWTFDSAEDMDKAIRVFDLGSHIHELMAVTEKFTQHSDEVSIPRYMSGDNRGVTGAGDTASGFSMLMGLASMPVKDMVRQFDSGITEVFIANMYRWNMRFAKDPLVKGDFSVVARGTTALIAQELMGKRLIEAASLLSAPSMAGMVDFSVLLDHILRNLSLPADIKLSASRIKEKAAEDMRMQKQAEIEALVESAAKHGLQPADVLRQIGASMIAGAGGALPQGQPVQGGGPGGF